MSAPPKKESILELAKLMDATVQVSCLGGRKLQGTLRGYDDLVNLVLDDCEEFIRGTFSRCFYVGCLPTPSTNKHWPPCPHLTLYSLLYLDPETQVVTDRKRKLGLIVIRGTQVSLVSPQDGVEEIQNPFVSQEDDPEE
jgi:U6 snRNA-associated Sm-like protein LSm7